MLRSNSGKKVNIEESVNFILCAICACFQIYTNVLYVAFFSPVLDFSQLKKALSAFLESSAV